MDHVPRNRPPLAPRGLESSRPSTSRPPWHNSIDTPPCRLKESRRRRLQARYGPFTGESVPRWSHPRTLHFFSSNAGESPATTDTWRSIVQYLDLRPRFTPVLRSKATNLMRRGVFEKTRAHPRVAIERRCALAGPFNVVFSTSRGAAPPSVLRVARNLAPPRAGLVTWTLTLPRDQGPSPPQAGPVSPPRAPRALPAPENSRPITVPTPDVPRRPACPSWAWPPLGPPGPPGAWPSVWPRWTSPWRSIPPRGWPCSASRAASTRPTPRCAPPPSLHTAPPGPRDVFPPRPRGDVAGAFAGAGGARPQRRHPLHPPRDRRSTPSRRRRTPRPGT